LRANANYPAVCPPKKHAIDDAGAGGEDDADNGGGVPDEAFAGGEIVENGEKAEGGGG
jgi:hypothetical protein